MKITLTFLTNQNTYKMTRDSKINSFGYGPTFHIHSLKSD
jgi:hypothetical protein